METNSQMKNEKEGRVNSGYGGNAWSGENAEKSGDMKNDQTSEDDQGLLL